MQDKFRIVTDAYLGFEVQRRRWWSPFWMQIGWGGINTHSSIEGAEAWIPYWLNKGKNGHVVKQCTQPKIYMLKKEAE